MLLVLAFEPQVFKQRKDHFHFGLAFTQTFDQRYYVNEAWLRNDTDTMILYIGGEAELTKAPGGDDFHYDVLGSLAKRTGALIFALEMRFFGKSMPIRFENGSADVSPEAMRLSSAREEIADLNQFLVAMDRKYCNKKQEIPGKTCFKWVIAGGSYPGAMAAWIAEKQMHLYAAALASSGVVSAETSLDEFDLVTIGAAGTPCATALTHAMREIEQNIDSGNHWPREYLGIPRDAYWDPLDFYYYLADVSMMAFQYGMWGKICPALVQTFRASGNVTREFLDYVIRNGTEYLPYSRVFIAEGDSTPHEWFYQKCTEVGYFEPTAQRNNVRSSLITLDYFYELCSRAYGIDVSNGFTEEAVQATNNYFGGYDVHGDNVIYTNYRQDVWHLCGLNAPTESNKNVLYASCKDCGHCCDLHIESENDPKPLREIRESIIAFFERQLGEFDRLRT